MYDLVGHFVNQLQTHTAYSLQHLIDGIPWNMGGITQIRKATHPRAIAMPPRIVNALRDEFPTCPHSHHPALHELFLWILDRSKAPAPRFVYFDDGVGTLEELRETTPPDGVVVACSDGNLLAFDMKTELDGIAEASRRMYAAWGLLFFTSSDLPRQPVDTDWCRNSVQDVVISIDDGEEFWIWTRTK